MAGVKTEGRLTLARVLDWLAEDGLLDRERADVLKRNMTTHQRHPLSVIAERHFSSEKPPHGLLSLDVLSQWLAARVGMPYHTIDPLRIDVAAVTAVMSYAYARRYNILAVEVHPDQVTIACSDPFEKEWEAELSRILQRPIVRVVANPDDIARFLVEFYTLSKSVLGAQERSAYRAPSGVQNLEQLVELSRAGKLDANDQHVVNIVDWLLHYAFDERASDIHLEPRREQGNIRFRIDGVMHLVYQVPASVMAAVTSRLKILGRMDLAEKRRPQDGRLKTRTPDGNEIELRLSTMPTAFGEKMVMRIFDPDVLVKDFRALGFTPQEVDTWQSLINQPHGIVLVTGPTGSGKTTTLYSTLKLLASPEVNVCTVEDPIEMVEPAFNQMQVQHNIGLDFASGVRTLLRQDPDIIMVGEIRDQETAEMAIQAALTGHLVFSTLHTNDAPSAITRLLEIGVPPYLITGTVLGVLAQRLIRTLCPHCKTPGPVDSGLWQSLVSPWRVDEPKNSYQPVGCLECRQTGYLGRVGIYEMLLMKEGVKKLITPGGDIDALRKEAIRQGLKPLRLNGAQKVAAGLTTVEEVLRAVPLKSL
ncbi:MAG: ATPase, T2SS/T4P/T4SS family [Thiohalomonadaceae bacterium]